MARRVRPEEYAARRARIIAAALDLIREKGYQEMTIADLLDRLDISKGAFYHYFRSKRAVLDGIVEDLTRDARAALESAADPSRDAVARLRGHLSAAIAWKAAHTDELSAVARMWRHENNALLKQRISEASVQAQAPLLAAVVRQGRDEGVFDASHPEEAAVIIAGMGLHLGDALIDAYLEPAGGEGGPRRREVLVRAHLEAVERILGARAGSLTDLVPLIAGTEMRPDRPPAPPPGAPA
ncbi:TetR/AcrR family transcriptional regulator [Nocardiopsis sp. CNT-189]|uniref:TetR/AcrR family transcriptional regulator n=1 Tax=Nocardiopsis oceanisediminis TaxID=2816862 RepID=UPI003B3741C8